MPARDPPKVFQSRNPTGTIPMEPSGVRMAKAALMSVNPWDRGAPALFAA